MQAYAKQWMKSFEKPRPTTTLGFFFVGLFILFWSSSITSLLGYNLSKGPGAFIFIGIALLLSILTILLNHVMSIIGIERPVRSGIFLSSVLGPYVNMLAENAWKSPTISHIAGFFASILAFLLSYLLDRIIARSPKQIDGSK